MGLSKNNKTVLVAPLDWGLGHATRCIPVIQTLLDIGCIVILASAGKQAVLLKEAFPQLPMLPLEGYNIHYGKGNVMSAIAQQLPSFFKSIQQEYLWLQKIIDEYHIDLVISDNRYGLYSDQCSCIFITHQLHLQAPKGFSFLEIWVRKRLYRMIERFDECWIPDIEDDEKSLGKKLSHPDKLPKISTKYIGWLTRYESKAPTEKMYELVISLSGPEPQRTFLENLLLPQLEQVNGKVFLVRGLPGESNTMMSVPTNTTVANHLSGGALQNILLQSKVFLTRSGYSTLMDLQTVSIKCIFVPTPGQTEQEYLASEIGKENKGISLRQQELNLIKAIKQVNTIEPFSTGNYQNQLLKKIILQILEKVSGTND